MGRIGTRTGRALLVHFAPGRRQGVALSTSYPDSVRFLYALGNEYKTIKLGLERIEALLEELGAPHRACRFIHVAGTNGKGSTCAMIESALRKAGVRTGLYTSPHLAEPTERIRIGGVPVSQERFTEAFERVHSTAVRMLAQDRLDMHPTYFETITAMAYVLFASSNVDAVVLETGMGGRLDATNVVDPWLSVITPIDFDHEKFLGTTIPRIASEKAGIIKPSRPVVTSRQHLEAMRVLDRKAADTGSPMTRASEWRVDHLHLHEHGSNFHAVGPRNSIDIECPLFGAHQVENALTAIASLDCLGLQLEQIREGIAATTWPGRLELARRSPAVFLDGAHNPAGARALAGYIRHFHAGRRVWMVFAAMRDKDLSIIGHTLFPLASELIFTAPAQTRAFRPEEIREASNRIDARIAPTVADALRMTSAARPEDVVFITGSLYLVGEARALLMT